MYQKVALNTINQTINVSIDKVKALCIRW